MLKVKIFAFALSVFLFSVNSWSAEDTITIARVSNDLPRAQAELKPFIDYLAKELKGHMGIKNGRVLMARDNEQLIRFVKEGRVDMVTETPFSSMLYCDKAGMKIILRRWKGQAPDYHSVVFARRDSKISSLEDLKGKVIAFEDPGSTTGYFLPKAEIVKRGIQMTKLDSYREVPPPDKIGYCFAKTDSNVAHWVYDGFVAGGVLNNIEYQKPEQFPSEFISDFKIIYESAEIPRNLILVRGDLEPKLVKEIKRILIDMEHAEEGRGAMWKMSKTTKFDEFPEGSAEADALKTIRELYGYVKNDEKGR